jgi:hypothetical protein
MSGKRGCPFNWFATCSTLSVTKLCLHDADLSIGKRCKSLTFLVTQQAEGAS